MCGEVASDLNVLGEISDELKDFVRLVRNPRVVLGSLFILCESRQGGYLGSGAEVVGFRAVDIARRLYGEGAEVEGKLRGSYLNQVSNALKELAKRGLVWIVGNNRYVASNYGIFVCSLLKLLGLYKSHKSKDGVVSVVRMPGISETFNMERARRDISEILCSLLKKHTSACEIDSPRSWLPILLELISLSEEGRVEPRKIYEFFDKARENKRISVNRFWELLVNEFIRVKEEEGKSKEGKQERARRQRDILKEKRRYIAEVIERYLMYYLASRFWTPLSDLAKYSDNRVAYARISDLALTQYFYLVKTFFDHNHVVPRAYRKRFVVHFLDLGPLALPLRFSPRGIEGESAYVKVDFSELILHYLENVEKAVFVSTNFPSAVAEEILGSNVFEGVRRFVYGTMLIPQKDDELFESFFEVGGYAIPDIHELVKLFNDAVRLVFWKSFLGMNVDSGQKQKQKYVRPRVSLLVDVLEILSEGDKHRTEGKGKKGGEEEIVVSKEGLVDIDNAIMYQIFRRLGLNELSYGADDGVKSIVEIIPIGTLYLSEIQRYSSMLVKVLRKLLEITEEELAPLKEKEKELRKKYKEEAESKIRNLPVKSNPELIVISREVLLRALAILTFVAGIFTKDSAIEVLGRILGHVDRSALSETAYITDDKGLEWILTKLAERIKKEREEGSKTIPEGLVLGTIYSAMLRRLIKAKKDKEGVNLKYSYMEKLFFTDYGIALAVTRLRDLIMAAKLHRASVISKMLNQNGRLSEEERQALLRELNELKEEVRTPLKTVLGMLSNLNDVFTDLHKLSRRLSIRLNKFKINRRSVEDIEKSVKKDRENEREASRETINTLVDKVFKEMSTVGLSLGMGYYMGLLSKLRSALEDLIDVLEYVGNTEDGVFRVRAIINFYSYPAVNVFVDGLLDRKIMDIIDMIGFKAGID